LREALERVRAVCKTEEHEPGFAYIDDICEDALAASPAPAESAALAQPQAKAEIVAVDHEGKPVYSLAQPQGEQEDDGKCRCAKYCHVANGGQLLKLDGTPRECRGLPGDNHPMRLHNRQESGNG